MAEIYGNLPPQGKDIRKSIRMNNKWVTNKDSVAWPRWKIYSKLGIIVFVCYGHKSHKYTVQEIDLCTGIPGHAYSMGSPQWTYEEVEKYIDNAMAKKT